MDGTHITLTVRGDLDIGTVAELESELFGVIALGRSIVVDLTDVVVIDSYGIALLLAAHQLAAADGTSMLLRTSPGRTGQLMDHPRQSRG